jgi:hypothetical protein
LLPKVTRICVIAGQFLCDSLAEGRPGTGHVLGVSGGQGLHRGVLNELRGVEVRLTGAEIDDIDPLGLHLLGLFRDGQRSTGPDGTDPIRKIHR